MPVPALGTLLPNLSKPSAGGNTVLPLSALASIPKHPKPPKQGCNEMGSALLAVIQDIQYLVPTRTLYKCLHETKEDLATGLVCLITVRRHPRTRPPVTFRPKKLPL